MGLTALLCLRGTLKSGVWVWGMRLDRRWVGGRVGWEVAWTVGWWWWWWWVGRDGVRVRRKAGGDGREREWLLSLCLVVVL